MTKVYYIDGEFVLADDAVLPVTDLALVRGYGVFDFFRTYDGWPIQLERNIQRLRNSANVIGLELPWTNEQIGRIVNETIARNRFEEASIRVVVTGGDTDDFITPQGQPRLLVYVEPLKPLPAHWYTEGVKVITVEEERQLPGAKSLNYISAIIAQKLAREAGAVEALYKDRHGHVREGTTTNLFAFYGDTVITPEIDILPGVTRLRMIEILSQDYTVIERPLPYEELLRADEAILTAANKQVVPIVQIDQYTISGGVIGDHCRRAMASFRQYVLDEVARREVPKPF